MTDLWKSLTRIELNCKQHVETPVSESYEPVHGEYQFNYDLSIATDQLIPTFLKATNYNV